MNKGELFSKVSDSQIRVLKKDATFIMDMLINQIKHSINDGEKIAIAGFGTFSKKLMPARKGFNMHTKEKIEIAAKEKVSFKPSKKMLD